MLAQAFAGLKKKIVTGRSLDQNSSQDFHNHDTTSSGSHGM